MRAILLLVTTFGLLNKVYGQAPYNLAERRLPNVRPLPPPPPIPRPPVQQRTSVIEGNRSPAKVTRVFIQGNQNEIQCKPNSTAKYRSGYKCASNQGEYVIHVAQGTRLEFVISGNQNDIELHGIPASISFKGNQNDVVVYGAHVSVTFSGNQNDVDAKRSASVSVTENSGNQNDVAGTIDYPKIHSAYSILR